VRIVVYGAGAVGSFFGGLLARGGHQVRFVARGAQLEALHERGLRIVSSSLGNLTIQPVDVSASASDFGTADLVLICVKTYQTEQVLNDIEEVVGADTLIVPLQNGIDADEILMARFGRSRVVSAAVYVVAALESPGVVRHGARGMLMLGSRFDVPAGRVEALAEQLTVHGLRMRHVKDIERERWCKLMWNTSFNAVSALTLQDTHTLVTTPETRDVIMASMREVAEVGRACGVAVTIEDVNAQITATDPLPPIRTSMLEDRVHGRMMESDALVGAVVRRGKAAGVPTPITAMLYALLKGIDAKVRA
jgi:2-dehydropantoate 2-reductase